MEIVKVNLKTSNVTNWETIISIHTLPPNISRIKSIRQLNLVT